MKNYSRIISVPFTKKSKILRITACLAILLAFCWQSSYGHPMYCSRDKAGNPDYLMPLLACDVEGAEDTVVYSKE
ncbi:MAG: hypothetical protein FVQ85_03735 [Planctomycetes bacterium]|nr:hypothetical protein [Planctomycetota bacterium]